VQVPRELILHVLDRRPRPDGERALPAVGVVHVLDEYPQVDRRRRVAGHTVVVTRGAIVHDLRCNANAVVWSCGRRDAMGHGGPVG